jgi:hypothetical protein
LGWAAVDGQHDVADPDSGSLRSAAGLHVDYYPLGEQRQQAEAAAGGAAGLEFAGLLWREQQAVAVAELGEHPADGVVGPGCGGGVGGPPSCLGPHCRPVDPACVEGMLLDQVEGVGEVPLDHGAGRRGGRHLGPLDAAADHRDPGPVSDEAGHCSFCGSTSGQESLSPGARASWAVGVWSRVRLR